MDMARTKLLEICERGSVSLDPWPLSQTRKLKLFLHHRQLLDRYGIRVVVLGRKDLLPPDMQASVAKVESMTAYNRRSVAQSHCCKRLALV